MGNLSKFISKKRTKTSSNAFLVFTLHLIIEYSISILELRIMRKISYRPVYNRKKCLNSRGTALVQVEAYLNKKKVYFSTHIYLRPEQWDVKKKVIKDHPNQDALNGMLKEFIIELERKELALWRQGKVITLNLIKDEFKSSTDISFLNFVRKEIDASQLKDSTKQNHLTTIGLLQSFKPSIEFKDLNYNFITSFEKYLYDAGYQMNTVAKHMKHLKSFVNAAINKGYIDLNDYAFRRYKIKMKEGKHVFLLPDEMKRLEELSLINRNMHFQHTLDAFLFCCYTGLRYSDFTNLTEKNIVKIDRELWLIFNSVKTGIEVKLPLNLLFGGKALNILTKYQNKWNTFFSLKSNSNINKELIRIGKLANIDKHFSFHTARHTNATLLIYKGANITTVQKLLGHKNLTTTQIYGEVMGSTIVRDLKKCQKGKD